VSVQEHLLTAEQFAALPSEQTQGRELIEGRVVDTRPRELVDGQAVRMSPAGCRHGKVTARLVTRLGVFVTPELGEVLSSETGFLISREPDTVRAPDAAFVRADRVPDETADLGYAELAPDLVVHVVSPWDRAAEVLAEALQWVDAGVLLVWVVDPGSRTVTVHRPGGVTRLVRGEGADLDGEDVLPNFRLALDELFG